MPTIGIRAAEAQEVEACQSVLEQDTEPQIAPDEQLAPWMAASAWVTYSVLSSAVEMEVHFSLIDYSHSGKYVKHFMIPFS